MSFPIKLPYALKNGDLIRISEVSSGKQNDCLCPECKRPLIAKKGNKVAHHFAHGNDANCNLESALHKTAKLLIYTAIRSALDNGSSLRIHHECKLCLEEHEGPLLKKVTNVKLETSIGDVRPDVLLLDKNDKPVAAIEVIFSHPPETRVKEFYESEKITLVEIKIQHESKLLELQNFEILHADYVSSCPTRKCSDCNSPLKKKYFHVVEDVCYGCKQLMNVCFIEVGEECKTPVSFNKKELRLAAAQSCTLKWHYSRVNRGRFLFNTCPNCNSFIENYMLDGYLRELENDVSAQQIGRFCVECEKDID